MASPPQGQMRPGRQLVALAAIFIVLGGAVWFGGKGSLSDRLQPKFGLDLVGGTRVTLKAETGNAGAPKLEDLEQARQVIEERVNASGVTEAEVVVDGTENIVITLAGKRKAAGDTDQAEKEKQEALANVGHAAQLFFRKVLDVTDGNPLSDPNAKPSASPSVNPSGSPKPSTSPGATSPSPKASGGAGGVAVTPTPSATPAPSTSPSAPTDAKTKATLDGVKAKVGAAAWAAAEALQAPVTADAAGASQLAVLQPFDKLDGKEVAVLPVKMQYNVPFVDCLKLSKRPVGSISIPGQQAVACEDGAKSLLDVSKVAGPDISSASPVRNPQTSEWEVSLNFNSDGTNKWTALTTESVGNKGEPKCAAAALGDKGNCRVAVVLDNTIISSPQIISVLGSTSSITGNFDAKSAKQLADYLKFGSLKMSFETLETQTVSATLGEAHLKAGLLAAGIGLLLVIIYSFFYYRLLGSVIFLSLVLSAALTFLMLVLLGRAGFTLTLAGIAGFIVSLGVAADSFVIYFERLKDEIREGRSPRSAVQRAWIRARKTILTANAITLMAAAVLYIFSSGAVKGFAAALGIATVLDLLVVFLFRYPVMAMFARTKAFLSPRVSGLGRVLREAKEAN